MYIYKKAPERPRIHPAAYALLRGGGILRSGFDKTKEAHYYGHENAGAYAFLLDAICNFSNTCDIDYYYTALLINWHMRPMVWGKSEKCHKRERELIGEEMYQDLMMLHKADISAK